MHILFVCPKYYPRIGGSAAHVRNLAERLSKDHEVEVFVPNPIKSLPNEEVINEVRVRRFKCLAPGDSYYLSPTLAHAVCKSNADIVHIHGYYDLTPALVILSKKSEQRMFFTLHSSGSSSEFRKLLHYPYNLAMRRIMTKLDKVICVSNFERDHFKQLLNLPERMVVVIPNGIDRLKFVGRERSKRNPPFILSAGRLEKYKGYHRVLRAFKVFRELYPNVDLRLQILGKGPFERQLLANCQALGLNDNVTFTSWLPDDEYVELLRTSPIFILLSDYESQSIVVSEAICAGAPIVVADNTALSEYVEQGYALGVQNPNDPYEVANRIVEAYYEPKLSNPSAYRPLTWDEVVQRTLSIYNNCG